MHRGSTDPCRMTDPGQTSLHLRAAIAGDPTSASWLIAHLSPLLVAQANWRLGPHLRARCEPEDLVQEAWLAALPRLAELQPREGRITPVLLRFLATHIVHQINNLARAALRQPTADSEAMSMSAVPAAETGVVSAAVRADRRRVLLDAIDSLEAIDREVLLLRGIEQRTLATTAELLGVSQAAVTMRLQRALQRVREHLPADLYADLGGDAR